MPMVLPFIFAAVKAVIAFAIAHPLLVGIALTGASMLVGAVSKKSPDSPTYSFGELRTQTNNQLPRPIVYGEVKCAGNVIWDYKKDDQTLYKIVAFGDGKIDSFSDVRFNDIPVFDAVDGQELLTNGNFETDLTGWTLTGDNVSLSRITGTDAITGYSAKLQVTIPAGDPSSAYFAGDSGEIVSTNIIIPSQNSKCRLYFKYKLFGLQQAKFIMKIIDVNTNKIVKEQIVKNSNYYNDYGYRRYGYYNQDDDFDVYKSGDVKLDFNCGKSTSIKIVVHAESTHYYSSQSQVFGIILDSMSLKVKNPDTEKIAGCSYTAYLGDGIQNVDSRVPGSTNLERIKQVGCLRWDAYLAITLKASEKINAEANITAILKGREIRVYSTPTSYSVDYSNNPAWCLLDYLTCYNGCQLNHADIDIQSFISAASYCDQLVDKKPRYTLNLCIDSKQSKLNTIHDILAVMAGYIVYQADKISLKLEKADAVLQVFDQHTIISESERFWTLPLEQRYDIVKIGFLDPANEWAKVWAVAEVLDLPANPNVQEVDVYGLTNTKQASRLAWFFLNQSQSANKFISFKTHKAGLDRTVGDLIAVTSTFLGYVQKQFRITQMAEAQEGQIEITAREYNPDLYADKLAQIDDVSDRTTLGNPFDIPPKPPNINITELSIVEKTGVHKADLTISWTKPSKYPFIHSFKLYYSVNGGDWRTLGTSYDSDFVLKNAKIDYTYQFAVQTINHRNIASDKAYTSSYKVKGKDLPPSNVAYIEAKQQLNDAYISWTPVSDVDVSKYEIRRGGSTWASATVLGQSRQTYYLDRKPGFGSYRYWVKAIDAAGNYSVTAISTTIDTGKIQAPSSLTLKQVSNTVYVTVSPVNDARFDLYELREGNSWEQSRLIKRFKSTNTDFKVNVEGSAVYFVKSLDTDGNYSDYATEKAINITGLPDTNMVIKRVEDLSQWQLFNMFIDFNGILKVCTNELLGDFANIGDIFGADYSLNTGCTAMLPVIDVGEGGIDINSYYTDQNGLLRLKSDQLLNQFVNISDIFGSKVILTYANVKYAGDTSIKYLINYNKSYKNHIDMHVQTSADGQSWYSDEITADDNTFNGRYVQLLLAPQFYDPDIETHNIDITGMTTWLDMPDTIEFIKNVDIPASKTTISFKRLYLTIPTVTVFVEDQTGKVCSYIKTAVSKTGFDLELKDSNNNTIAGKLVKAEIRGY